jgi:N-acetylneuraminate synthase
MLNRLFLRSDNRDITTIAEIGINHNGDINIAKRLIDIAKFAGFNFVKFQKRNPEKCVPEHKKNELKDTPWGKITYLEYKKKIEFGLEDYIELSNYSKDLGIQFFASVWDLDSAEFMRNFTDIVKIPSALITDIALLEYCRDHFKYRLMSTGMSTEDEITAAVRVFEPHVIFHCNSSYPARPDELNLRYIEWLKNKYPKTNIGYSGHEYGIETTYLAVAFGATWIERHVTLEHYMWGSDQYCSLEPEGMIKLVRGLKNAAVSLGECRARVVYDSELGKRSDLRK